MRSRAVFLVAMALSAGERYRPALPGYIYQFPRDYFNHPEYRTEWWYYTGNVEAKDGRRFGFELTFFRQGLGNAAGADKPSNVWDTSQVWLAHLALSDIDGERFLNTERLNRSGGGIAGVDQERGRVWNGNWQARWTSAGQELEAVADGFSFRFRLEAAKPPAIHGIGGVSQKSAGAGNGSHYFSQTRLETSGSIVVGGQTFAVQGLSWMDHEFFTHRMSSDQAGWDWFSLQFEDGSELMLYELRKKDGTADGFSSGTYIDGAGRTTHLAFSGFRLAPGTTWASPKTGARYPVAWKIEAPSLGLDLSLSTRLPQQELAGGSKASPVYWEGAVEVSGSKQGKPVKGKGYLEMTGYAGPVNFGG